VGRKRKKFAVHRALIRSQSTFFNDAFIEADPASLKTELHLPCDSVSIFEIYMGWIYRGGGIWSLKSSRELTRNLPRTTASIFAYLQGRSCAPHSKIQLWIFSKIIFKIEFGA
jgi:hypothetical protein